MAAFKTPKVLKPVFLLVRNKSPYFGFFILSLLCAVVRNIRVDNKPEQTEVKLVFLESHKASRALSFAVLFQTNHLLAGGQTSHLHAHVKASSELIRKVQLLTLFSLSSHQPT